MYGTVHLRRTCGTRYKKLTTTTPAVPPKTPITTPYRHPMTLTSDRALITPISNPAPTSKILGIVSNS